MNNLARFLFETGMLKKMRRTGYPFLGSGQESVADHCFRAALLGYHLGLMEEDVDAAKVALLLLHHDLPEARTNDLNYVHKRYVRPDEDKVLAHQCRSLPAPIAARYQELYREFNQGRSREAQLAHDADQLDFLVELKEQKDLGNPYAERWIYYLLKRLVTNSARELAEAILSTDWTDWWFEKQEELWTSPKAPAKDI